jgi:AsmA protein
VQAQENYDNATRLDAMSSELQLAQGQVTQACRGNQR